MKYKYEAILRWLIKHPEKTQKECAQVFGYSPSWLSRIINSAEFRHRQNAEMEKMINALIKFRMEEMKKTSKFF